MYGGFATSGCSVTLVIFLRLASLMGCTEAQPASDSSRTASKILFMFPLLLCGQYRRRSLQRPVSRQSAGTGAQGVEADGVELVAAGSALHAPVEREAAGARIGGE